MQGFGYGAEDFDAGLSEAIDRARKLLKNVYATGGRTASRPGRSGAWFPSRSWAWGVRRPAARR